VPTRVEWQQLAEDRLLDAQVLLTSATPRWSAAYYLSGYAVECGLKACVLLVLAAKPEIVFEDKKLTVECWTHDLEMLLKRAELKGVRDADASSNKSFKDNWHTVGQWTENSRYSKKLQTDAEELFEAITNPKDGVMQWVRRHW
jgi:HEPN domain-containing protein